MALIHDFYKKNDCFIVVTSGSFDLQQSTAMFEWVLMTCKFTDIYQILIDYRKMEVDSTETEKVLYANEVIQKHQTLLRLKPIRIVYLGTPSQVGGYQPGYRMAKNERLPILLTSDPEEATSWLGLKEPYT